MSPAAQTALAASITGSRRRGSKRARRAALVAILGGLLGWALCGQGVTRGLLWLANTTKAVEVAVREGF